jgi:mannose/fructose/N-acetylgalactosamine-specific phosphotransferase system component IIB
MKNKILLLFTIFLMSFISTKQYIIKLTEAEINYHWQNIENIKSIVDQSNMPHNQVSYIIKSLDSLQNNIKKSVKIDSINNGNK